MVVTFGALGLSELRSDDEKLRQTAVAIFRQRCVSCHGESVQESNLRLDSWESFQSGGDSGLPLAPVEEGHGELLRRLTSTDEWERMPPEGQPLSDQQIRTLKDWITNGGGWPSTASEVHWPDDRLNHWAWKPLTIAPPPSVASRTLCTNEIDQWLVGARQVATFSPETRATNQQLIRRLFFDLVGLPPTPEQVEAFVEDRSSDAYERLVDDLLRSPRYGERWARHWLDVVHYADTHGYDKDQPRPNAWPYRDYVIRALNEDKHYAKFVEEQIAGDVLFPQTRDGIEALGFLAAGPWDLIGHAELPESKIDGMIARHLDRDDIVGTVLGTFCSITIQCAQCHDHKFDPITQREYYSLQAVFAGIDRAERKYYRDDREFVKSHMLGARLSELEQAIDEMSQLVTADELPYEFDRADELIRCIADSVDVQTQLAELPPPDVVFCGCVYSGSGNFCGTGNRGGQPRPIYVLSRGSVTQPVEKAIPGAIHAIGGLPADFSVADSHDEAARRAALARWISAEENPLTWRSIVNRVWQQHFGKGIVETANDFGQMGSRPSNLKLLDWLAADFRDHGGSLKRLHKQILMSEAYRAKAGFGLQTRRKLDAEAIRDSVLAIAGTLDLSVGGPGFQDFVIDHPEHSPHYEYGLADPHNPANFRRSIYRFIVRSQTQPLMTALDCADPSVRIAKRNESESPLQSLALLNNQFLIVQSEKFAERLRNEFPDDVAAQVCRAVRLAYSRHPTDIEVASLTRFAETQSLEALCRVLLNSNEFIFID